VLHTEEYADYKSARKREKFLKSGQGRRWLDDLESQSEPASGGYSPKANKKQIPYGGLCAYGAFKSSRPDQSPFETDLR
jgi:hypothetical protein